VSVGEEPLLTIAVQNVGGAPTKGPIEVSDVLSGGLVALKDEESFNSKVDEISSEEFVPVGPTACELGASLKCVSAGPIMPGAQLFLIVRFEIPSTAMGTLTGSISVSGGGASGTVHAEQRMTVGPIGPFEFTEAAVGLLNVDGSVDSQAASDPAEYTTTLHWKSFSSRFQKTSWVTAPVAHFKDVVTHLPPGMIGNPSVTPVLCRADQLAESPEGYHISNCPAESQIGIARVELKHEPVIVALYNLVPPYGVATELGFSFFRVNVLLDAYVRPGDHGIDIVSRETSTSAPVLGAEITVWGNPADSSHDPYRDTCLENPFYEGPNGMICPASAPSKAFLRTPTSCSGEPLAFGAESNSYEKEDEWAKASFDGPTMKGCEAVPFWPSIAAEPTSTVASSPTGVSVKLSLPQTQNAHALATADLKKAVVTLPEGMAINPSSADGLQVCDDAQLHLESNAPAECPDGSKIGTVLLHTQLISEPLEGSVFLRPQNSSDPMSGEMFRMAIELRDDARGLDFKIPGQVQADPVTGRLTTTFDDNPQFPFEDISLQFKSGARAPLVTPASCQAQTTLANLYSWAQPDVPVHRASSFELTSGPEGSPCPGATLPFSPSLNAGVSNVEAGAFTPFLVTFLRKDSDQGIQRVSVKMPPGLLGSLGEVSLCSEAQANAGTCDQASEIGSVTVGVGAGPTPFYVTGGKVFITGPYRGAPFGLSVVVPAKAGPFDLGTVVVRSTIEVDPHTAQITVTTDPLPQIVKGVPVNIRLVNVTVNRPRFIVNPTNCDPLSVAGAITGGQGTVAHLENRFQVTNCTSLGFKPKFTVSTSGKTSRTNGASLIAKIDEGINDKELIAKAKVSLPKQLVARLTTLQKACPAATFEANPAACPPGSRIGTARATTPVLPVPVTGPMYFVSHGGETFPNLVIVLQGDNVTVDLVGDTFINPKTSITSTTFKNLPDVHVNTFELILPQGPNSALAANGNLCNARLKMPTTFIAQNGAKIRQATPITVSGCPKHKAKKARKAKRARKAGRHRKRR
jgi:hypothetical protein